MIDVYMCGTVGSSKVRFGWNYKKGDIYIYIYIYIYVFIYDYKILNFNVTA